MSVSPQLLAILVCPRCKGRYPVRDDIPIMLIDEASPL
jgi:uncharacterized protein YbaR (Trm112 family)